MTSDLGDQGPASGRRPLAIAFLGDANSIHLRRWAGYFAVCGHRVSILVPADEEVEPGLPSNVSIEYFLPYSKHRVRALGAFESRRSMRNTLSRLSPDILHAHYLTIYGWYARLAGFHPYVVTVWGSDVLVTVRESLRARLYARLALSNADLVTGDSAALVRAAVAAGARPDRTTEVQFGVDTRRFSPGPGSDELRERLGLAGRRVLFSPRTIAPLYRHEVLLEALARLPADVSVLMTRHLAHPGYLALLEARALELGLGDRLRIIPAIEHDEMVDAYRIADVVVSIPAEDGTPVTLLEALATGRPVVASDLPSVREWLGEIEPEALVPVDDSAATARAIEMMLSRSTEQRAEVAARGRALVERRANYERSMAGVEVLYRRLVRRP